VVGLFKSAALEVEFRNCLFHDNTGRQGAIMADQSVSQFHNCLFIDNHGHYAGAISVRQGRLALWNFVCDSNTAAETGGCIYLDSSAVDINTGILINNMCMGDGGAIKSSRSDRGMTGEMVSMINNHAGGFGGALYAATDIYFKRSSWINNTARSGYHSDYMFAVKHLPCF
jgi:predicted outer membrane repeat protein